MILGWENRIVSSYVNCRDRFAEDNGYKKGFLKFSKQPKFFMSDWQMNELMTSENITNMDIAKKIIIQYLNNYRERKKQEYISLSEVMSKSGQKIFKGILQLIKKYDLWFDVGLKLEIKLSQKPQLYLDKFKEEFVLKYYGTDLMYFIDINSCCRINDKPDCLYHEYDLYNELCKNMKKIGCFFEHDKSGQTVSFSNHYLANINANKR